MSEAEGTREAAKERQRRLLSSLSQLEQQGGREFDAPGLAFVEGLLARSRELGGEAGRRLEARAQARLDALASTFAEARVRAGRELERLSRPGVEDEGALAKALEMGDVARVMRSARCHRRREKRATPAPRSRGATACRDLYRHSLADLCTTLSSAKDVDMKSEQAGQLNGRRLSARILQAAEALSPAYRRSLVASLIDLAPLLRLAPPPLPGRRG